MSILVSADDVTVAKNADSVDSKWWGGGRFMGGYRGGFYTGGYGFGAAGFYGQNWLSPYWSNSYFGCGLWNRPYNGLWFKSAESHQQRRAVELAHNSEAPQEVTCKNSDGKAATFRLQDCEMAARKMVNDKLSEASCQTCTLSAVSPQGKLIPAAIPVDHITSMAREILSSCRKGAPVISRRSPSDVVESNSHGGFALLLAQGNEQTNHC